MLPSCTQKARCPGDLEGFWEGSDYSQAGGKSLRCVHLYCARMSIRTHTHMHSTPHTLAHTHACTHSTPTHAQYTHMHALAHSHIHAHAHSHMHTMYGGAHVLLAPLCLCAGMMAATLGGLPEGVPFLVSPSLEGTSTTSFDDEWRNESNAGWVGRVGMPSKSF